MKKSKRLQVYLLTLHKHKRISGLYMYDLLLNSNNVLRQAIETGVLYQLTNYLANAFFESLVACKSFSDHSIGDLVKCLPMCGN